jgi:group II intron reverse transcriptase/maturase
LRALDRGLDAERLLTCWHDLNKDAASGGDQGTAEAYAVKRHAKIEALVERLQRQRYRAQLVRRGDIPTANGKERPRGIPTLADKLGQLACAKLFTAISEQDFLDCSYGYRPGRGALEAGRDLTFDLQYGVYGYVVAVDGKGCFDHLDHPWLVDMLWGRIEDRAFLKLIQRWLHAGGVEPDGQVVQPETGTPQGGTVSPVLAQAYVHYALALWFPKVVRAHGRGEALVCRSADDWVGACR